MKINKLLLLAIILGFVLRIIYISVNPPSLTPDEASLGYNAYSILKTGRDEYGKVMPIIFKSFGDYKPGLYVYLTAPSVALFGLNEFSVRFPSVIFGVIAIYLIYLIVRELFKDETLSVISAFFLAIAPWHVFFSRGAWEINVALTLTLFGIYFFLKSFEKSKNIIFSAVFFALTLITYQGAKLSTLIVLLVLTVVFWKECRKLFEDKKRIIISTVLGLIIAGPILLSLFQGKTGRLSVFSIFSYPRPKEYLQSMLVEGNEKVGDLNYLLFHSEVLNFKRVVLGRWVNYFSGQFLFFEGDWKSTQHSAPYTGVFVIGDLVLFIAGFIYLSRRKEKGKWFIFLWLLLSPLPGALSRDTITAVRSFNEVTPLVLLGAFGLNGLVKNAKTRSKKILLSVFLTLYVASYVYFLDEYFVHLPKQNSQAFKYGYKQMVQEIAPVQANFDKVVVQQSYDQPYIYFLFYERYDPAKYQKMASLADNVYGDVGLVDRLDNISFSEVDWSALKNETNVLVVTDPVKVPPDILENNKFRLIKDIKYLDGVEAFKIIEVK